MQRNKRASAASGSLASCNNKDTKYKYCMGTKARNLAGRDVADDVDLVALLLRPLDLAVDPVQVTPRIVKVEHQPKIEVIAEVGVHGQEAEAGSYQHLMSGRFNN